ncbi:hypothetical protein JCM19231_5008 [Vibrio ishigakensis]|uniref:Uncharacterized protein n=1 Tax=Vibrio ishigakensis TaxID=1481914 RepID=A0A0B8P758_9VIBR|nr:hypothetical protein JCM19231_5008 [Vibrio ishigakensis]
MVLGLKGKVFQVAFPFKEIERLGESEFKYQFEGKQYLIHWDKNTRSAWISNSKGETVLQPYYIGLLGTPFTLKRRFSKPPNPN